MYFHELKSMRKPMLLWILSLVGLALLYFSIYPSIVKDAADFKALLSAYPPSIRAMLGISLDNISSLLGFYSMIFSFITLFGAIQAMNLGLSILSKEVRERTADFLLVKPVSRQSIISAKILAAFTVIAITNIVYTISVFVMANSVSAADYSGKLFLMINLTLLFIQLIFFAIGTAVSVFIPKIKSVLPISLGVIFLFYFVGAFLVKDSNDIIRYFSPFKYFDITYILNNSGYEISYLLTGAAIIIISIIASYIIYIKKDIHAVS